MNPSASRREGVLAAAAFGAGFFPFFSVAAAFACFSLLFIGAAASALARDGALRPVRTWLDGPILLFIAAWGVAALAGLDPAASLGKWNGQARFVLFYLLAWEVSGRWRAAAVKGLLCGGVGAVAYGLLQWGVSFLPPVWDWQSGRYAALVVGRVHGAVHPLTFAELLLPVFFLSAARALEADGGRDLARRWGAVLAVGLVLFLTQSRGPWLGAAAGLAVLGVFHPRRIRVLLLAASLAPLLAIPSVARRAATLSAGKADESKAHRWVLWHNTWQVAKERPWLGVGPGRLGAAVRARAGDPALLPNPMGREGDAHSLYLHHFAERGVAGLLAVVLLLTIPFMAAAREALRPDGTGPPRWLAWGAFAFFAAFPVINLTERVLDDAEPAFLFWILAALLVPRGLTAAGKTTNIPSVPHIPRLMPPPEAGEPLP